MTITPDKVLRTDMTKNLTPDEAVAVNDLGHVLSRADRATIESAYPGHAIFGAADFAALDAPVAEEPKARKAKVEEPVAPVGDGVALTSIAHPETSAPFDENAGLNPASLETVEIEAAEETKPVVDGSAFDRDGDGKVGGSPKSGRQRKPASN